MFKVVPFLLLSLTLYAGELPYVDNTLVIVILINVIGLLLLILNYLNKRNKKQLQQHNDALEQVHRETIEAERVKDTFLANVSHETRTPMNAIIGLSHILLQSNLDQTQRANISKIKRSAEHLMSITNDILDFSKIEAGKLLIRNSNFELDLLFSDLSDMLGLQALDKKLELLFDIDKNLPKSVNGDLLRISQVLINLLNNAIKFTEKGEVLLRVNLISVENDIYKISFEVKDTGIGLTEEQSSKLFQAFDQADNKISRKYGGTGLGLAISKELVEKMGGQLEVESRYREGSRFFFTLDLEVPPTVTNTQATPLNRAVEKKRVLVLEPNKHSAYLIHKTLTEHGAITTVIQSIDKLYAQLTKQHYDLLIIDENQLPRLKDVNALNESVDASIVLKYDMSDNTIESDLNIHATVLKPFTYKALLEAISEVYVNGKPQTIQKEKETTFEDITVLKGSKILLAEDNEGNQMVIEGLLEGSGIDLTIVADGQKAVEAIFNSDQNYELILMDINMPVMDGYVATSIIREYSKYDHIPIIAITANINESDIGKSKSLGMQDHLSKPVDVPKFYKTLLEYIKPKVAKQSQETPKISTSQSITLEAIEGIDVKDGLSRLNGNTKAYQNVLFKFSEMFKDVYKTLEQHLEHGEYEEGRALAHSLKGLSGNIGAKEMYTLAKELEDAFKAQEGAFAEILTAISSKLALLLQEIETLKANQKPEVSQDKKPLSQELLKSILDKLQHAAKKRKALEIKKICQEIEQYQWPSEYQKAIHDILSAAQAYKFEIILNAINEINSQ